MKNILADIENLAIAMTAFTLLTLLIAFVTGIEFVLNFSLLFSLIATLSWGKYYLGSRRRIKHRKGLLL